MNIHEQTVSLKGTIVLAALGLHECGSEELKNLDITEPVMIVRRFKQSGKWYDTQITNLRLAHYTQHRRRHFPEDISDSKAYQSAVQAQASKMHDLHGKVAVRTEDVMDTYFPGNHDSDMFQHAQVIWPEDMISGFFDYLFLPHRHL